MIYLVLFILGVSITINIISVILFVILYKNFMKNNPLSTFGNLSKTLKDNDKITDKVKNLNMEYWDL